MVTGNVTIKFDVDDCRVKCTVRGELPQAISTAKFIERLLGEVAVNGPNIVWVVQHDGRTHSVWWSHFDAQTCADNIATLGVQTIIEQRHVGE
tara:strand:- start:274 stop:552 length:279 start_codon:yes stop_codon:yes gene_type:complete